MRGKQQNSPRGTAKTACAPGAFFVCVQITTAVQAAAAARRRGSALVMCAQPRRERYTSIRVTVMPERVVSCMLNWPLSSIVSARLPS